MSDRLSLVVLRRTGHGTPCCRLHRKGRYLTSDSLADAARELLADVRSADRAVHDAVDTIRALSLPIHRAGARREIARHGAPLAGARDRLDLALGRLVGLHQRGDDLEAELDRAVGDDDPRATDARVMLGTARRIMEAAGDWGVECARLGDRAAARVRGFAEFHVLHLRVSRQVRDLDLGGADAGLERLAELAAALTAPETTALLDELQFRRLVQGPDGEPG